MKFGKYEFLRKLGSGGMAEVYLATADGPEGFKKHVAIKRVLPDLAESDDLVAMFLDEARLVARFNHPNIVQIFELGKIEESYFVTMEYVHGASVAQVLRACSRGGRRVPVEVAAKIVSCVCDGLHYAHNFTEADGTPLNLVHRDVNPQNIMLNYEGIVKLLDFGIAKAGSNQYHTRTASLKGKAAFMSPEQVTRKTRLDSRSDIFSLGCTLYCALTGHRPFNGDSELDVLMAVVQEPTPDPRAIAPNVPDELVGIVSRAMEKERDRRYPSARDMGIALEQFLRSGGPVVDSYALADFLRGVIPPNENPAGSAVGTSAAEPAAADSWPVTIETPTSAVSARSALGPAPASTVTSATISSLVAGEASREALLRPYPAQARAAPARSRRSPAVAGAAVVVLLVVTGLAVVLRQRAGSQTAASVAAKAPPADSTRRVPQPDPAATLPGDDGAQGRNLRVPSAPIARPADRPPVVSASIDSPTFAGRHPPAAGDNARNGLLQVFVKPFGEVFVDGASHGITPLDGPIRLRAGRHTLHVRCDRTGKQETRRVVVEVGRTHRATVDLR